MIIKRLKLQFKNLLYYGAFLMLYILNAPPSYAQGNYEIGLGIYDITGEVAEANFFGYAELLHRNEGIRDRQYSRAYIIQEPGERPVVFVCIDKGATFESVNQAVMVKLAETYGDLYTDENVVISATHTHVATGGFSFYSLYNTSTGGFFETNFENAVEGIYQSIVRAHNNIAPGEIYYNRGTLTNASINRSLVAYENNVDAADYPSIDEEMTVLKFVQEGQEVGMISWFAVHPTNLSKDYEHNSGDNKGYAALNFERLKGSTYEESGSFVAAFANTNAGDLSPNLNLPPADDFNTDATGPGETEEESADIIGQRQFDVAWALYNDATTQLTGSVEVMSRYNDFSNILVAPEFTDGEERTTCPAALGLSFLCGAEDGRSGIGQEGDTKDPDSGSDVDVCHAEKPIAPFFFLGQNENNPAAPKILSTTILKIGQLGILAAPAEFTVMAGRRARATVEAVEGTGITTTVLAGYSDSYAGYVATREEYAMQHYEGASTHFGPWTLGAFRQEFQRLALKLVDPSIDPWPEEEPEVPEQDDPLLDVTTIILYDNVPLFDDFGDLEEDVESFYAKGSTAQVIFWGAHPNNDLKVNGSYFTIEWWDGEVWEPLYFDRDLSTKFTWDRDGISYSQIIIEWEIPMDAPTGYYRILHSGKWKQAFTGSLFDYYSESSSFYVE